VQYSEEEVFEILSRHGLVFAIEGDFKAGKDVLEVEVVVGLVLLGSREVHVAQAAQKLAAQRLLYQGLLRE
jgi:hypothetical protein